MSSRACSALLAFALVIAALPSVAGAVHCPNVMFVLDRSGSMADPPDANGNTSKWALLQAAVQSVLAQYSAQVPFGMEMFTSDAIDNDAQCYSDTHIDVECAHDTEMQILAILDPAMPDSGTNTGEAIRRANADPVLHDTSRANFIILITDGDPNCNSQDQCFSCMANYTVAQIKAAAAVGIHTFVVGFDGNGGVDPTNLNLMAQAGMEPQNMGVCGGNGQVPCYYSASDAQKFNDAISAIVDQVVSGGEFGNMTMCDDSCAASGCPANQICVTSEQETEPHCEPDPCAAGLLCDPNTFCRGGVCVPACLISCGTGMSCVDGECMPDACAGVTCPVAQVCDPLGGACIADPCPTCATTQICDAAQGRCVDDQCQYIKCPTGTTCVNSGNCEAPAATGDTGGGQGKAGCSVARQGGDESGGPLGLALAALLLVLTRRTGKSRKDPKSGR